MAVVPAAAVMLVAAAQVSISRSLCRTPPGGVFAFGDGADGGGCRMDWPFVGIPSGRGASLAPGQRRIACRQRNPRRESIVPRKAVNPRTTDGQTAQTTSRLPAASSRCPGRSIPTATGARVKWRRWMGIEPTWNFVESHTGFEDQERHQVALHLRVEDRN